ncbi:hypothetical protein BT67DRAFT_278898 [Trichocladium antarcticum]|uniref:Uncharacterized protein n=1 Tax=Trichocladium antarcticum TaxID=1450529 RepID=A0AAN6ZFF6_9PEZI|nr:hypothetical protein BT67DRAFT_278898 [Trichocladium antarcticum]
MHGAWLGTGGAAVAGNPTSTNGYISIRHRHSLLLSLPTLFRDRHRERHAAQLLQGCLTPRTEIARANQPLDFVVKMLLLRGAIQPKVQILRMVYGSGTLLDCLISLKLGHVKLLYNLCWSLTSISGFLHAAAKQINRGGILTMAPTSSAAAKKVPMRATARGTCLRRRYWVLSLKLGVLHETSEGVLLMANMQRDQVVLVGEHGLSLSRGKSAMVELASFP